MPALRRQSRKLSWESMSYDTKVLTLKTAQQMLEGEKVIQDLCSVPYATAMLLGLIYGLNLYPPELRYTFEVLQKLFLVLDGNKLSK